MHILLYAVVAALLVMLGVIFSLRRRIDAQTVRLFVRRAFMVVASFAFIICLTAACLVCCYSSVTGYLKETLSAGTVEELKMALKLMFGSGSAFSALQTLVISSLMLCFVSCTALGMGGMVYAFVCRREERMCGVEGEQHPCKAAQGIYVNESFLVYGRYNS